MKLTKTKLTKTFAKVSKSRKAIDVLYKKMVFYDDKAKQILKALLDDLRNEEKKDAKLILAAMKLIKEADDIAIDCAVKLAPFQTPKLESVEVNQRTETRYVMIAPALAKSEEAWMRDVGAIEHKPQEKIEQRVIEHRHSLADYNDDDVEDTNDQRDTLGPRYN